jgi:hypothetical protein
MLILISNLIQARCASVNSHRPFHVLVEDLDLQGFGNSEPVKVFEIWHRAVRKPPLIQELIATALWLRRNECLTRPYRDKTIHH